MRGPLRGTFHAPRGCTSRKNRSTKIEKVQRNMSYTQLLMGLASLCFSLSATPLSLLFSCTCFAVVVDMLACLCQAARELYRRTIAQLWKGVVGDKMDVERLSCIIYFLTGKDMQLACDPSYELRHGELQDPNRCSCAHVRIHTPLPQSWRSFQPGNHLVRGGFVVFSLVCSIYIWPICFSMLQLMKLI